MSFGLLDPVALFALAALAVPLLLHLTRRGEQQPTRFAALRWLDARVRPRRRFRIEEWLLLAVRLALVALAVLLLAAPVRFGGGGPAHYAGVVPGADPAAAREALAEPDVDWHWLAPDFPALDAANPGAVPTASLLRELDARLPPGTRITVFAPEDLGGLDGARPELRHEVDWRVLPGRFPEPAPPAQAPGPVRVSLRYAPEQERALRYVRASVAAWNTSEPERYVLDAAVVGGALPARDAWLIWLADPAAPALADWIKAGGTALVVDAEGQGVPIWREETGDVLARLAAEGQGRRIALARALRPEALPAVLDADFHEHLKVLFAGEPPPPTRAHATATAPRSGATVADLGLPLDRWLALALALLFALERFLATGARLREPA